MGTSSPRLWASQLGLSGSGPRHLGCTLKLRSRSMPEKMMGQGFPDIGTMENKMGSTIVHWGNFGTMEHKMERVVSRGHSHNS